MDKKDAQALAAAAALATVTLLENRGMLREHKTAIERTEEALRQYPVWKGMDEPTAVQMVRDIDACLESAKNDPYIDTIRLFYFEGKKNSVVADAVYCDERTAQRNRRSLVKRFAARLYPREYIQDMDMREE